MQKLPFSGLTNEEVIASRSAYGANHTEEKKKNILQTVVLEIVAEPLFILLSITAAIYYVLGELQEGSIMLIALLFVAGISIFQEQRSRNAVNALKVLTGDKARVIRNGELLSIPVAEVVVDDILMVEDGDIISADAHILLSHDLSVNESALTGESLPVYRNAEQSDNVILQGTTVASGAATAKVLAVGKATMLGKIGKQLNEIEVTKTPLQIQIRHFIRLMVLAGAIAFLIVCGVNYYQTHNIIHSLLHGLTLAMSILPEEIPVAFSTFMALGAYHLYRKNVITKSPYTVETLGAATVICSDKTGTITSNQMTLAAIYDAVSDTPIDLTASNPVYSAVLEYAMWASEPEPFDQMEKSIHHAYGITVDQDLRKQFMMVHEYPLDGTPAIMTHVFANEGEYKIGCKGGMETLLPLCYVTSEIAIRVKEQAAIFAGKGFRILAVAKAIYPETGLPLQQTGFSFDLLGLVAFYDPPKENMREVISAFYKAGIQFKMITGDHPATAVAIAHQVGMKQTDNVLTGEEVMRMDDNTLSRSVANITVYARMFPDAKLRIVEALKSNGEIVAMTGDGVNDGPALKAAHIGIAMGTRGTETAKKAAALILADDELSKMVDAIALGRRIYENLKKAIRYIISIHVPIILIVTLPLLLMWDFADIFLPIHVIFLELIMGPTCSIVFENEPIEPGSMERKPRRMSTAFFSWSELYLSIIQGLAITAVCLGWGYYLMHTDHSDGMVRAAIFTTLMFCNIFLTLANRSFIHSIISTLRYKNRLIPIVLGISLLILMITIEIEPARALFHFDRISPTYILLSAACAIVGVLWIEIYKYFKRKRL